MKREEITHLATLSRIRLTEKELVNFEGELSSILAYVGVVKDLSEEGVDIAPQVGDNFNVFRQDVVTNNPDQYTKAILAEVPRTEGRYLLVKKILDAGE